MPGNEQDVIDTVFNSVMSLSNELSRYAQAFGDYSQDAADKLERGFDNCANTIRQSMRGNSWVPESIKPPPPPPKIIHLGFFRRCTRWVNNNQAISAAAVGFMGTTAFLIHRHRIASKRKRKARRAATGAKTEVVVLAGSPFAQTTKSIALDLEKRGFLVYIPVGSLGEEAAVAELRLANIHALNFDITSPESTSEMLEKLSNILYHPHRHGTDRLHFASLVVLETSPSELNSAPTQTISTSSWSDALNTRVLYPISLTQIFLPLLISESKSDDITEPTTLVIITPSNISSINAPTHARESVTTAALSSYVSTLRAELPTSVTLSHIRLGSLAVQSTPSSRLDVALARVKKFAPGSSPSSTSSASTSPARSIPHSEERNSFASTAETKNLHHGVFDAVVGRSHGTVFLGRGALLYAIVGAIAPGSLVSWMMGFQR